MAWNLDIEKLEEILKMRHECYFESYVGTDKEDLDVTDDRLEEIFSHQPDASLLTKKEYIALMENIDQALKECENDLREM